MILRLEAKNMFSFKNLDIDFTKTEDKHVYKYNGIDIKKYVTIGDDFNGKSSFVKVLSFFKVMFNGPIRCKHILNKYGNDELSLKIRFLSENIYEYGIVIKNDVVLSESLVMIDTDNSSSTIYKVVNGKFDCSIQLASVINDKNLMGHFSTICSNKNVLMLVHLAKVANTSDLKNVGAFLRGLNPISNNGFYSNPALNYVNKDHIYKRVDMYTDLGFKLDDIISKNVDRKMFIIKSKLPEREVEKIESLQKNAGKNQVQGKKFDASAIINTSNGVFYINYSSQDDAVTYNEVMYLIDSKPFIYHELSNTQKSIIRLSDILLSNNNIVVVIDDLDKQFNNSTYRAFTKYVKDHFRDSASQFMYVSGLEDSSIGR